MMNKNPVDSKLYSRKYYYNDNEGGKVFFESNGMRVSYRFKKFMDLAKVRKGHHVLDIGCGRGEIVIQSALQGAYGLGIDYSRQGINLCNMVKKQFPAEVRNRMHFDNKDVKKMRLPKDYFDRIFMLDVIEHLHDWEIKKTLSAVRKTMKDDGIFIIHTTPNTDFYKYGYPVIRAFFPVLRIIFPSIMELINTKPNWKNRRTLPKDPEEGHRYNKEGHINEQNPRKLRKLLKAAKFIPKVKLIPFTREVKSPLLKFGYALLSLPLVKNIFCAEIIVICKK